ncbi:MAG: hypothetical protein LBH15_05075, partial [Treponema sp.]|nr:hypothetical protein [Treponema sp.]
NTAETALAQWRETVAAEEENARALIANWKETARRTAETLGEEAAARSEAIIADADARDAALAEKFRRRDREFAEEAARRNEEIETAAAALEDRVRLLREQADADASRIEAFLADTMEQAEERARAASSAELEAWRKAAGENFEKWRLSLEEMDEKAGKLVSGWDSAAAETTRLVTETGARAEALFRQTLETAAEKARDAAAGETERVDGLIAALDGKLKAFEEEADEAVAALQKKLASAAVETGRKVLEETDARLGEYRAAQARQYEFLDTLAEDSSRLDGELRRYMQETENRVRQDFALFEETSNKEREAAAEKFGLAVRSLREELDQTEKELEALKAKSYDNVSRQLDVFESDFTAGLARRGDLIEKQLEEWKLKLDSDLSALSEDFSAQRQQLELNFSEELRERLQDQRERLTADLEHLKAETDAFGESIQGEMAQNSETLEDFKKQLEGDLSEARSSADIQVRSEIGRFSLSLAENLKQAQRDMASSLRQIAAQVDERGGELSALQEASRKGIEEWKEKLAARIKDTDNAMEEMRRRARELVSENEERISAVRAAIEDVRDEAESYKAEMLSRVDADVRQLGAAIANADRRIQDFVAQTKLFEQADALKQNLEQRIEDLRGDIDGLDQRRAEAAELEAQFAKIKRLEDEINAKMTRFLSEQRRIELMEADFNRLLLTSQAVETKLTEVTASDDTLQAIQVQIRKFNDALSETEEKFQHIEKKNQTLEAINQGVDRNFSILKQTDAELKRLIENLKAQHDEQEALRLSIEKLAADNEKAQAAADKLTLLDRDLSGIESRIKDMQRAREWIARAETRLEDLNKEIQDQVKLVGNVLKEEGGPPSRGKGAPTISTRENVIKLARQGWKTDEIAKAVKLSRSEVELILDLNSGSRG